MADASTLDEYISGFFGIGSKATVKQNKKDLLERLISYEVQALSAAEQLQTLENLGISTEMFGKNNKVDLAKGTHDIYFTIAFTDEYSVIATGTSSSASVGVMVTDDSNLDYFTIKVFADCTVRWSAKLITE